MTILLQFLKEVPNMTTYETGKVVGTTKVLVYSIKMPFCEDADLLVAESLYQWQQTDLGKWVMKNSKEPPIWHKHIELPEFCHRYDINAFLDEKDHTYFSLKYL
jgi:hypothetical protein